MSKAAELAKMGEVLTNNQIGGRRNILINGAMQVAQRGTSFTSIGGTAGVYSLDRMRYGFTMNSGRLTITQSTDTPNGFANSLKVDITTAESSLNAASGAALSQFLEGQDVQQFKKGTSDAEQYTLSFHVKSNITGTYIVELFDNDNTRQVSKSYTIDSANTWEKKTITFPADTTGAFDDDNDKSLFVQWFLASGTNTAGSSATLNTSWASSTDANRAVGQANLFSSTDNEWYITGMQLEVGSTATPFEHRSFGEELQLCKRYFQFWGRSSSSSGDNSICAWGMYYSATLTQHFFPMQVEMRANPTVTTSTTTYGDFDVFGAGYADQPSTAPSFFRISTKMFRAQFSTTSRTSGYSAWLEVSDATDNSQGVEADADF